MTDRLEGPRRKLARARHHFADVTTILEDLRQDNMSYGKQTYNAEEGRYEFALQDDWVLSPDLPLIVGDVLHNARSSLDHLAWALAKSPGKQTGFPILDPARPLAKTAFHNLKKVQTMKRSARIKLEQIQPYNREDGQHPLWWVNELDIADKHRIVLRTEHGSTGFGLHLPDGYDIQPVASKVERGATFAYVIGPFDPDLQLQVKPNIDVVFVHKPVMLYQMDWVLTTILDNIELKVFAAFTDSDFW